MIFRQLLDQDLGCACYLLGDAGRGVVVDPGLDVERILAAADADGLRVELVLETHVHADHVSGRAELARRTGASVRLPAGGGYEPGAGKPLRNGDVVELGELRIEAVAAPGHRPEHTALLVFDRSRGDTPWMLLSGDSLLVGDLARPDLAVAAHEGASDLHATLGRFGAFPDGVELWPGHVGGSLCGGPGLSRKPSSTLGYERAANALLHSAPDEFAARLIGSLPERPPTVEHVVARNRRHDPAPERRPVDVDAHGLASAVADGATLLDARSATAFDAAHVRGSLSLALSGTGLGTRAAWVLEPDAQLAVLADDEVAAFELARRLRAVGLAHVRDVTAAGVAALAGTGLTLEASPAIALEELPALADALTVVDVRDAGEWRDGHLADAVHLPLARLRAGEAELPAGPLAVVCKSGGRAAFAASWLRARGHDARRVAGGGVPDLPRLGLELAAA